MSAESHIAKTLNKVIDRFPRRAGTDGWDLQKMHGAFVMGHEQLIRHGNADCWNSSYGERMHQSFFTRLGRQTQRRFSSLAAQVGDRRAEAYTTERAVNDMHHFLMPHQGDDLEDDVDDESSIGLETTGWNYHDDDIPLVNDAVGSGKYSATLLLNQAGKVYASVKWSDNDKQVLKKKMASTSYTQSTRMARARVG